MTAVRPPAAPIGAARRSSRAALAGLLAAVQVFFGLPLGGLGEAAADVLPPRVWLGPIDPGTAPGASLLSKTIDETTRKDLVRRRAVETADQPTMGSVTAGEADPRVEQAERLRSAGKQTFRAGKPEQALEELRAALELYEAGLPSINKMEAVLETLGYLGAVSHALEYDADARDFFRRVIAMAPDAEPLDEYPDAVKATFADEKAKLLGKKRGTLKVITEPPGATVRLDGIEVGQSPLTLRKQVRGDHYVQAAHDTAGLAGERVRVKGGGTTTVTLTLATELGPPPPEPATEAEVAALVALARSGNVGAPFREMAEAIAKKTRTEYVVVSYVSARGNGFVLDAFIYGVEEKQTAAFDEFAFRAHLASASVQAKKFADAVEAAVTGFPTDKVVIGGQVAVKAPEPPPVAPPPPDPDPAPAPEPAPEGPPPPEPAPVPDRAPVVNRKPVPVARPALEDEDEDDDGVAAWVWVVGGAAVVGAGVAAAVLLAGPSEPANNFDAEVKW